MKYVRGYTGPTARDYVDYYRYAGRGAYGQIFSGSRFHRLPILPSQHGTGVVSMLGGIVRGITGLISRSPKWLREGAKIAGTSALRGLASYGDEVKSGLTPVETRKRALKEAFGDALEQGAKRLRGSGCARKRKTAGAGKKKLKGGRKKKKKTTTKKKKKCCRVRTLTGGRIGKRRRSTSKTRARRSTVKPIKGRSKFDLLSV